LDGILAPEVAERRVYFFEDEVAAIAFTVDDPSLQIATRATDVERLPAASVQVTFTA
jgi:hypothetical protein